MTQHANRDQAASGGKITFSAIFPAHNPASERELALSSGLAPWCTTLAWLLHTKDPQYPWPREIVSHSSPCVVIVGSLERQI